LIETTQSVHVRVPMAAAWDHVRDIRRWAELMPGLQECEIINEDDSRWVLKVGVGAMVRKVTVLVHVDEWDGPARAVFSYKLQGDPVSGGGTYHAVATPEGHTALELTVRVVGGGPLAPMWEAMGGPLLPKFALAFAEQLRDGIEQAAAPAAPPPVEEARARRGVLAAIAAWLRRVVGRR
jgi:carbon monoxide dehydrogenase subunit G